MRPTRFATAQALCRPLPPLLAQRLRYWIYPPRRAYQDDQPFVVRAQTGSLFKSRTGILQAYPFSVHGYYDWRNCAIALTLCSPGDTIVEIGANIGTETTCFADVVGPSGKVFAFEPLPSNVRALRETLSLNRGRNVTVLPYAVADRAGALRFALPARPHNFGDGHLVQGSGTDDVASVEVECVTLDSLADRIGPASMVFMEPEGAEVLVLRGARGYIERHRPGIVLEATPKLLARAGFNLVALYAELRELNYAAFRIARLGLVRITPDRLERETARRPANWLCLHSSRLECTRAVKRHLARCGLLPCIAGVNPLTHTA